MKWAKLFLDRIISLKEWTIIRANVEGLGGEHINGSDRIVVGFLPCDVNQSGVVNPVDLLTLRQYLLGVVSPLFGVPADFADVDRNGALQPLDLLRFKQLILGVPPATQTWTGKALSVTNPLLWPECCR